MKLSSASIGLVSIIAPLYPHQSSAISCGIKGITKPCIGDSDIRYDPDVSYNLEDQDDYWKRAGGLYMGETVSYTAEGDKRSVAYLASAAEAMRKNKLGTYDFSKMKTFTNTTISGSRLRAHQYHVAKHNGDGVVPGFPGVIFADDAYYTSSFEKDGSILALAINELFGQEIIVSEDVSVIHPIENRAIMELTSSGNITQTSYCLDENCDQRVQNNDFFTTDPETGKRITRIFVRRTMRRVNKDEWMSEFNQALNDFNIPSPDSPFIAVPGFNGPNFVQPFDASTADIAPECYTLVCPTEDMWKQRDPVLGTSPYVEPDGIHTGGFIAIITIASIIIACAIFYCIYKRGVEAREKRVKVAVLKSMAQSMNITTSKALSPTELQSMFKKIDEDGNGNLSKDEVKGLVDEAGVANMSDRDYATLFSSIDLDGNGTLDFVEFCNLFTSMGVEDVNQFKDN